MGLKSYWKELQRRHVVKAGIAYLVVAWLVLQVLSILFPAFEADPELMQTAIIVMVVGFPIWLILAWVYDFSWGRIQKTEDVPFDAEASRKKNIGLNRFIIATLAIAVVLLVANTYRLANKVKFEKDGRITLAVLPFDNFSPDPANDWIGDGMTDDILTSLTKIDDFRVISRTSVMQYKRLDHPIPEISKMLGANYFVVGSVRGEGNEVLVTVQLVNSDDEHIWADHYNTTRGKILDFQAEVAAAVTEVLLGELTEGNKEAMLTETQIDPEAQRYLTLGHRLIDQISTRHAEEALSYYEKALEIEPDWYEAMVNVALLLPPHELQTRDSLIQKALVINPKSDQAIVAKAILLVHNFRHDEAEKLLLNSVTLDRDAPLSHDKLASHYLWRKLDYEKALYHANESLKIGPLNLWFVRRQINAYIFLERFQEADSIIQEKRFLFDEEILTMLNRFKVEKIAEAAAREARDYRKLIDEFQVNLDAKPTEKAYFLMEIARGYNLYFNDDKKFLEYALKAWEARETVADTPAEGTDHVARIVVQALLENGKIEDCRQFLDSEEFLQACQENEMWGNGDRTKRTSEWLYQIARQDYEAATLWIRDDNKLQILTDAYFGLKTGVQVALQKDEYSDPSLRAQVFAILREPDSVFHYLKNNKIDAPLINSSPDFDPYRKDPSFMAFRQKHYLQDVSID